MPASADPPFSGNAEADPFAPAPPGGPGQEPASFPRPGDTAPDDLRADRLPPPAEGARTARTAREPPGSPPPATDPTPGSAPAAYADGAVWRVRRAGGGEDPPVHFARLKAMVEARELSPDDRLARGDGTFWPALEHPAVRAILRRSQAQVASTPGKPSRRFPLKFLAVGAAALLALALAAVALVPGDDSAALDLTREAFSRRLDAWRATVPPPAGKAVSHVLRGRARLREATPESLRAAAAAFRDAVLLDPDDAGAIAGYVEARALGDLAPDDRAAVEEAKDLIDHAAQLDGDNAAVLRANAHLLLSLDTPVNLLQARALAEAAVERSQGAADDLVALARSRLTTSPEDALRILDRALAKEPGHPLALRYRDRARQLQGGGSPSPGSLP
jgi:tetratricopeptide (TPR) repeat protein